MLCGLAISPTAVTARTGRSIGDRVGRRPVAVHCPAGAALVLENGPSFGNQRARLANGQVDHVADTATRQIDAVDPLREFPCETDAHPLVVSPSLCDAINEGRCRAWQLSNTSALAAVSQHESATDGAHARGAQPSERRQLEQQIIQREAFLHATNTRPGARSVFSPR